MRTQFILLIFMFFGLYYLNAQTMNFWTKKSDFTGLKRTRAVSFTVDDYAYVGTGVDTAEQVQNDFWKYDPILDTWTQVANLPGSARRNAVAFSVGAYGYVGTGMSHEQSSFGTTLSDFWRYDPASNTWTSIANYPGNFGNGIYFATAFSVDGKGYVCCGKAGPNAYRSDLWEYNPASNSWSPRANFPGGVRYQLASFTINNSAFVGLGTDNDMYRDDIWEYKPSNNLWIQRSSLPASERSGAATFTIDQRGYVCMGNNGGLLDDLWEYNPYEDHWEVRDNYSGSRRKWAVGFTLLGKGYVGLGDGYSGKKQSMYMYTPLEGLSLDENQFTVNVFPNPSSTLVSIESDTKLDELRFYDFAGRIQLLTYQTSQIDVSTLADGNYILAAFREGNFIAKTQISVKK